MPGSNVVAHSEQHVSAGLEGSTSPQITTTSVVTSDSTMHRDLPQSANGSPEGSTSHHILAMSAASGVTMRHNTSSNGSSSSSSTSDESITQECVILERLERQIFHLQQQLPQTLHAFDHMRGSFGVSPFVVMSQIGRSPPSILLFMTNRAHLNNNDATVMHDDGQSQLSNSGMMNGTEYHSSVSAYTQPVTTQNPHSGPMFSPGHQVFNSQETVTTMI